MPGKHNMRYRMELGKWETEPEGKITSRTLVIGHRNPDTDSIAAATAYANLKACLGDYNYSAGCAGLPQKRTQFLFEKFNTPIPKVYNDVWPRITDIVTPCEHCLHEGETLLEATEILRKLRTERLPVTGADNKYIGMVSLFDLADRMFQTGSADDDEGFLGRSVTSSINLVAKALEADELSVHNENAQQTFYVYVGAMNLAQLKEHLIQQEWKQIALVVGDREDVHQMVIELGIGLLVVTGSCVIEKETIDLAKERGVSILQTHFDSATTVRRMKFSSPIELSLDASAQTYQISTKLRDIRSQILAANHNIFPAVNEENEFIGLFTKHDVQQKPPFSLALVDHNEIDQAVEGAEDVPISEIIDHHRLGMRPTDNPIRVINDVVGSTCTLVAEQYRQTGIEPKKNMAGIMLGGIVSDTLGLRSPTSTGRDRLALEWLARIAECDAETLEQEILNSGSPLANLSVEELVDSDLKIYEESGFKMAIGQIEEAGFENLATCKDAIRQELKKRCTASKYDFIALMVTNIVRTTSVMIATGDSRIFNNIPFDKLEDDMYDLPGFVSRKKQLLPAILNLIQSGV